MLDQEGNDIWMTISCSHGNGSTVEFVSFVQFEFWHNLNYSLNQFQSTKACSKCENSVLVPATLGTELCPHRLEKVDPILSIITFRDAIESKILHCCQLSLILHVQFTSAMCIKYELYGCEALCSS